MKKFLLSSIVATVMPVAANATILFSPTNSPSGSEQTIQFETQITGQQSFFGDTNQTATPIQFSLINGAPLGESSIGTNGKGQADIICTGTCGPDAIGGANGSQLTDLRITMGTGFGATDFVGNLDFGEGTAKIAVTDQLGATFNYTLGNGQNFFTLNAINGEVITNIEITEAALDPVSGDFGWNDFKQPRVSGVCTLQGATCTAIPVSEPKGIAIMALGIIGLLAVKYRRRQHYA